MTQIHIKIMKPKTGGLDPVTGTLRFRPVRRHFDAAKNLIIAASFDADLSEDGELTVDLLPTTPAFVWQVVELADSPQAYTRYVEVPNSQTEVEYADLVEVDAGTFVPKDMGGVAVKMRPPVGSLAEAETESDNYPGYLVWYPEGVSTAKAREILESLEQLQADAQTSAATTFALKSQAAQDAGMVSDAATAAASSVTADADAARQSIRSKQTEATAASPDIAVVGDAKPTGITVTPESLTLRVGETASLNVNILPDYAPQEFAANILDKTIATTTSK